MQVGGAGEPGGPGYHGGNGTGTGGGNGTGVGPINFDNSQLITIDIALGIANICLLLILLYILL